MKSQGIANVIIYTVISLTFITLSCKKEKPPEPPQETVQKPIQKTAQEGEGIVTFVLGDVKFINENGISAPLRIKDIVKPGSVIETGNKSYATFQISEIGVIHLRENSRLEIKDIFPDDSSSIVDLKSGSVFSKIVKKRGVNYKVRTMTMVASVRGTQFLVHANPTYKRVLVREGSVVVSTVSTKEEKTVTKKMTASIDKNERITLSSQTRTQELILEKYALHPYIKDVETKTAEEIERSFKKVNLEEKKINEEIEGLQETLLDKLRKQGKPLVKLYLKDGSQLIGAIEESTAEDVSLNTGENIITIPKTEIKRRTPVE